MGVTILTLDQSHLAQVLCIGAADTQTSQTRAGGAADRRGTTMETSAAAGMACLGPLVQEGRLL